MHTNMKLANLATRQLEHRLDNRLALRRLRVALMDVLVGPRPEPTHAWDDVAREQPRSALPCAKERTMLHAAIRQGRTTPERITAYRLHQLSDDLAQFDDAPLLEELIYVQLIREQAEAIDAQTRAHATPCDAARETAIRETHEASLLQRAYVVLLQRGRTLLHSPH